MGRTIGVLEHKDADAARQRSAAVQQLRPGRVILLRSAKGSAMVDVILFPAARRRRSIRLSQCVSAGGDQQIPVYGSVAVRRRSIRLSQ